MARPMPEGLVMPRAWLALVLSLCAACVSSSTPATHADADAGAGGAATTGGACVVAPVDGACPASCPYPWEGHPFDLVRGCVHPPVVMTCVEYASGLNTCRVEKATGLVWLAGELAAMPDESAWEDCTEAQEVAARAVTAPCP